MLHARVTPEPNPPRRYKCLVPNAFTHPRFALPRRSLIQTSVLFGTKDDASQSYGNKQGGDGYLFWKLAVSGGKDWEGKVLPDVGSPDFDHERARSGAIFDIVSRSKPDGDGGFLLDITSVLDHKGQSVSAWLNDAFVDADDDY